MDVVAIRHVEFEDLGVWEPEFVARDARVTYLSPGDDVAVAERADLTVVLGAPVGVSDAASYPFVEREISLIRGRLAAGLPTLGVCLGAQMVAAALGARVYSGEREIRWGSVALTEAGAASPLAPLAGSPILHWHGDTFDLPDGATLLASTPATPHQAFSVGSTLALQFHCEADGALIERWLVGHATELAATGSDVNAMRADSHEFAAAAADAGRAVLARYLDSLR